MYKNMTKKWLKNYELAKKYYEEHGDLNISKGFKTINGYEYDENGYGLGIWLSSQRLIFKDDYDNEMFKKKKQMLMDIGMKFEKDLSQNWIKNYELAKKYYEEHGNLNIPQRFKTKNGYEYDEDGINLGIWIFTQRQLYRGTHSYAYSYLNETKLNLLKNIGMRFDESYSDYIWFKQYELAKKYYECYDNLNIPKDFKTINGYEYDEKGSSLGSWFYTQRKAYIKNDLEDNKMQLLKNIGIDEQLEKITWMRNYELAKKYYECYGNLEIPYGYKTGDGFEEQEKEHYLGIWLNIQRHKYQKGNLSDRQINLLEKIGMSFDKNYNDEQWYKKYELAKAYYEHYGNSDIPYNFKTTNGYEYDENGIKLGMWVIWQRSAYKGAGTSASLSEDKLKLLQNIKMHFEYIKEKKIEKYELAKKYYEHYSNLNIPYSFKTKNGYEYDENGIKLGQWIFSEKMYYIGRRKGKIEPEYIKLLEDIGIIWISDIVDIKLQAEKIDGTNIKRKKVELNNRLYTLLNMYEKRNITEVSKEQISNDFINELNKVYVKKK